jgi:hypothetical protein
LPRNSDHYFCLTAHLFLHNRSTDAHARPQRTKCTMLLSNAIVEFGAGIRGMQKTSHTVDDGHVADKFTSTKFGVSEPLHCGILVSIC